MLVSLNWLKDFVDIDVTPKELEAILTDSGTKVETFETVNENEKGIVAGKILEIKKHPEADRLFVCTVNVGEKEPLTIITSAKNVFEGALVPVAVEGSILADGTEIKNTEFFGIKSQGMFCSVEELGMNKDLFQKEITEGIYILPEDFVEPGTELRAPLWIDDKIYDIELTANRGDCQSVLGIAKETAAALDTSFRPLNFVQDKEGDEISDYLKVEVLSDECPRYTARMFKVKKIEDSPMWMQLRLLNSGVRPINNIVDVTNYVMLEMGQPLHAFDYESIGTDEIVVRTGNTEKTVTTLDEKERPINEEMLMITNGQKPIAVAGIMGGLNSEIKEDTKLVVLESANFDKTSIRKTSKDLGLRTESSARYEKGIYPELAAEASARAAYLFEEIGAATPIEGFIDIVRVENPNKDIEIELDIDWLNKFLGTDLKLQDVREYLNRLFLGTELKDNKLVVRIPPDRQDLRIKEDLAEEVARLYGYNNIPLTIMSGDTYIGERTKEQRIEDLVTDILIGLGSDQTMTTSFIGPSKLKSYGFNDWEKTVIINPLGEESSLMRPSLLPHQLEVIAINQNRGNQEGSLFEIQKTYHEEKTDGLPSERKDLVLTEFGKDRSFYDLKGKLEEIFDHLGIRDVRYIPEGSEIFHPGRKAKIKVGDLEFGQIGEIHPATLKENGIAGPVIEAELSFDRLCELADETIAYEDLPKFPDSTRDLALVVGKEILSADLIDTIKHEGGDLLESVNLFDVYTGSPIPEDKKSLAYTLVFRHPEKTLTDQEVNEKIEKILNALSLEYNAELR